VHVLRGLSWLVDSLACHFCPSSRWSEVDLLCTDGDRAVQAGASGAATAEAAGAQPARSPPQTRSGITALTAESIRPGYLSMAESTQSAWHYRAETCQTSRTVLYAPPPTCDRLVRTQHKQASTAQAMPMETSRACWRVAPEIHAEVTLRTRSTVRCYNEAGRQCQGNG
jgi:hypothetical protein